MDDENQEHGERRKPGGGVWMSAKQIYATGSIVAALGAIPTLNVITEYITKANSSAIERIEKNQKEGFDRLEAALAKHVDDEVTTHRRIRDLNETDIAANEVRCNALIKEVRDDVKVLQTFFFKSKPGRGS